MVKTCVFSDTHGEFPNIVEEFDLFLICGDVVPAHDHYYSFQKEWLENEFVEWINSLPFRSPWSKVIMTPGNHDLAMERWGEEDYQHMNYLTNGRLIILRNKRYDFEYIDEISGEQKMLKIFGTPYCQIFGNWAFMRTDSKLKEKFSEIPEDVDVLISHSAPRIGKYGTIQQGYYNKTVGCPILAEAIKEKKPRYAFCGHIHSGDHELKEIDGTIFANVSYADEGYYPSGKILKLYI